MIGIVDTLLAFLQRAGVDKPPALMIRGGCLESYGVPIAKWEGDELVIFELAGQDQPKARMKHRRWLIELAERNKISWKEE